MYVGWYVIELIEVHLKPQADETPWIFFASFFPPHGCVVFLWDQSRTQEAVWECSVPVPGCFRTSVLILECWEGVCCWLSTWAHEPVSMIGGCVWQVQYRSNSSQWVDLPWFHVIRFSQTNLKVIIQCDPANLYLEAGKLVYTSQGPSMPMQKEHTCNKKQKCCCVWGTLLLNCYTFLL